MTRKGKVFTWGATNYGRLGVSAALLSAKSRLVLTPTPIEIPPVSQLVCGDFHMVALTKVSQLYWRVRVCMALVKQSWWMWHKARSWHKARLRVCVCVCVCWIVSLSKKREHGMLGKKAQPTTKQTNYR